MMPCNAELARIINSTYNQCVVCGFIFVYLCVLYFVRFCFILHSCCVVKEGPLVLLTYYTDLFYSETGNQLDQISIKGVAQLCPSCGTHSSVSSHAPATTLSTPTRLVMRTLS